MTEEQKYEVNFFKPLSAHAKANKKLILWLAIIWAVAVFGFQFALMILSEPTPEDSYELFTSTWQDVIENENVTIEKQQDFSKSLLFVLGKNIAVKDNHKAVLKETLSWSLYTMQPDSMKNIFMNEADENTIALATQSIGLASTGFDKIMIDLLPSSLQKVENIVLSEEIKNELPKIMELYLIHNRSVLTDFNFLGFPFHYWYTAQFLLILFVVLCLVYALIIDKTNTKYNFVEET